MILCKSTLLATSHKVASVIVEEGANSSIGNGSVNSIWCGVQEYLRH